MKSQLVILQFLLVIMTTNATDQCGNLLQQCKQFKAQCSPAMITITSCCDLTDFPLSKAPSGVYQISTNCSCGSPFTAAVDTYCDMSTADGGWIVIQRNVRDGVDTFDKPWKDFEEGFGELEEGKMWYGLKALNCFTKTGQWELRIDVQFTNKTWTHLHYTHFRVGNAMEKYKLNIRGFVEGIHNPFILHNGAKFSTSDNDNDIYNKNCAMLNMAGWWYNNCHQVNLNQASFFLNSITRSPLMVEMKMRQRDCITQ